jgi:hypothetical protein
MSNTDRDDYLWDGSGEPDPEVQRLERLLTQFRHEPRDAAFQAITPVSRRHRRFLAIARGFWPRFAVAAALAVAVIVTIRFSRKPTMPTPAAWTVNGLAGSPRIGNASLQQSKTASLTAGQSLETDAQSRAEIHAESLGEIDVEPNTRLRVLNTRNGLKHAALDRGTIEAYIWASPGEFVVDTPAATTVDLGCAYTLHVDPSGNGSVKTMMGWVGFARNGRESFIPAGAMCSTRPRIGPGTPFFEDAPDPLRSALERFDFDDQTDAQRAADLAIALRVARPRDAMTVWHLLSRVPVDQRSAVYERLQQLAPSPVGVTQDGILHLDRPMLDAWWNSLGFDNIAVWRRFERTWPNEIR